MGYCPDGPLQVQTCEDAARTLGVRELRDANEKDLGRLSGDELKRARHVVRENDRVLEAVRALRKGDFAAFGRLMYDSHFSLRDDFEVSTPELDAFVETARGRRSGSTAHGRGLRRLRRRPGSQDGGRRPRGIHPARV